MSSFIVLSAGLSLNGNLAEVGSCLTSEQLAGANVDHLVKSGVLECSDVENDDDGESVDTTQLPGVIAAIAAAVSADPCDDCDGEGCDCVEFPESDGVDIEAGAGEVVTDAKANIVIDNPKPAKKPKPAAAKSGSKPAAKSASAKK